MEEEIKILKKLQNRYYARFNQAIIKAVNKIMDKHQEVLNEKENLEKAFPKLQHQQNLSAVVLDIGGTKFSTSVSVLHNHKNSFFDVMFSERWQPKAAEDGSYFIDRDPFVFRHVLNFMRDRSIDLQDLNDEELHALEKDAEFYQLDELKEILEEAKVPPPPPRTSIWQYRTDDETWSDYDLAASDAIEAEFLKMVAKHERDEDFVVKSGAWYYQIEFDAMKQRNFQHENHKERDIRRVPYITS